MDDDNHKRSRTYVDSYGAESDQVYCDSSGTRIKLISYLPKYERWKCKELNGSRRGRRPLIRPATLQQAYTLDETYEVETNQKSEIESGKMFRIISWGDSASASSKRMVGRVIKLLTYNINVNKWTVKYTDTGAEGYWATSTIEDRCEPIESEAFKRAQEYANKLLNETSTSKLFGVDPSDIGTCSNADDQKPTAFTVEDMNNLKEILERHDRKTFKIARFAEMYGVGKQRLDALFELNLNKQETEAMKNFEQKLVTHIRGHNADDMNDDQILKVIQDIENEITTRRGLKTHTKTQVAKITELEADIESLVKFLDGRNELLDKD